VLVAGVVLVAGAAVLAADSWAGVAALVVGTEDLVTVDAAGATVLVAAAAGPVAAGAEACVGAVDGCAGAEVAGGAAGVEAAGDAAWLAGWAPSALADEVVVAGPDGAGG
jgi:hypothetical protein